MVESLREEVTGRCRAVGDEGEDLRQQLLLESYILWGVSTWGTAIGNSGADTNDLGVELGQPGLAVVVEDQHGVYHGGRVSGSCLRGPFLDTRALICPNLIRCECLAYRPIP